MFIQAYSSVIHYLCTLDTLYPFSLFFFIVKKFKACAAVITV